MRTFLEVTPDELLASVATAIGGLEPRKNSPTAPQVRSMIDDAFGLFTETAKPHGIYQSITPTEFEQVYRGEGGNDDDTPLDLVIEDAVSLALFAVTLGQEVSQHISDFFDAGNPADGYILDQIASFTADELAQMAAAHFRASEKPAKDTAVLPYSPGYCGWNVTGQRALFAHLEPDELGISLNSSCLMHPIKSVSGVLVLAPITAHEFSPGFPCCATCTTLACQERAAALRNN